MFSVTRACCGATTSKAEKAAFSEASTLNINTTVRDRAHQLQDKVLICKVECSRR